MLMHATGRQYVLQHCGLGDGPSVICEGGVAFSGPCLRDVTRQRGVGAEGRKMVVDVIQETKYTKLHYRDAYKHPNLVSMKYVLVFARL